MAIDLKKLATRLNPDHKLDINNPEDQKYYIDFSPVRGDDILDDIRDDIMDADTATCHLFSGHIGCGKSTELLKLKKQLEDEEYHVIYFESDQALEIENIEITSLFLVIARYISESLASANIILKTDKLKGFLQTVGDILNSEVTDFKVELPWGKVGVSNDQDKFSLSLGLAEITTKTKNNPRLKERLDNYVLPQKTELIRLINDDLLKPAQRELESKNKKGLVVIIDNLDRISDERKQHKLFLTEADSLKKLACHVIYTMPLSLRYSQYWGQLEQRFHDIKILPMVRVHDKQGNEDQVGLNLLYDMVLARSTPEINKVDRDNQRNQLIRELFTSEDNLKYLCQMSGGHVRDLLKLFRNWVKKDRNNPSLTKSSLERVIAESRSNMRKSVDEEEWKLLKIVKIKKEVSAEKGYKLIESRLVFEYREDGDSWEEVNPVLLNEVELE